MKRFTRYKGLAPYNSSYKIIMLMLCSEAVGVVGED